MQCGVNKVVLPVSRKMEGISNFLRRIMFYVQHENLVYAQCVAILLWLAAFHHGLGNIWVKCLRVANVVRSTYFSMGCCTMLVIKFIIIVMQTSWGLFHRTFPAFSDSQVSVLRQWVQNGPRIALGVTNKSWARIIAADLLWNVCCSILNSSMLLKPASKLRVWKKCFPTSYCGHCAS